MDFTAGPEVQNYSNIRTIHVATAGTLPDLISETDKYNIEELTLTGELNGTDFRLLRDMAGNNYLGQDTEGKLRVLNFSGAKIVAGGEKYLDTNNIKSNGIDASGSFHYGVTNNNVVPQYVFFACDLENVSISNTATSIGDKAFSYCKSLTSITIPNSVTNIGKLAFEYCSGLTSINIPNSVTSIGNYAFSGCKNLNNITSEITNPFTISEDVFSTYNTATLTVPNGTKAAYQQTNGWKQFVNIVEAGGNNIVVTAKSFKRNYGDTNPTFTYTVSGGTLNGTPKITCSATKSSKVGEYTIKIERGTVTNSNVSYVNGTLTIEKAPLTITAKSYTRKEGESNPTFEVTYSGFKNSETSSVLTKKPIVSTTATINSPAGTYDLVPSGAEATNYSFTYVKGTLTVTELTTATFTLQGISYKGTKASLTATVTAVDNNLTSVKVPETVTYDGKTYSVTAIDNYTIYNRRMNCVELPSTVKSINRYTFYGSELGALIWNASASLPSSVFYDTKMSTDCNFLLYVKSSSYAPSNVANVIVNNTAQNIKLSDQGNVFYCPKQFTANNISYTHHYGMTTGGGKGWETIALPFKVQTVTHISKGTLTPFANYDSNDANQRPFWLYTFSTNGFVRASSIEANKPYIIAMPNNTAYAEEYRVAGDVTFKATNVTVPVTPATMGVNGVQGLTFMPVYSAVEKSSDIYVLNASNSRNSTTGNYDAGSRFIRNLRNVYPFEACLYSYGSNARETIDIAFDNEPSGIDELPLRDLSADKVCIYSLDGRRIVTCQRSELQRVLKRLPISIYIVDGKKVSLAF